jgi:para-aminobenzoate synthetase / 4-amino-4-deoxychorismate lyase
MCSLCVVSSMVRDSDRRWVSSDLLGDQRAAIQGAAAPREVGFGESTGAEVVGSIPSNVTSRIPHELKPTGWSRLPTSARAAATESVNSVLLETLKFDASNRLSYLFLNPKRTIAANRLDQIPNVFSQIEGALADGFYVAGFLSYECGYHFEAFSHTEQTTALPLAWFGVYANPTIFDHGSGLHVGAELSATNEPDADDELVGFGVDSALSIPENEYLAKISKIKEYIAAGDTYQINFTDRMVFPKRSSGLKTFARLSEAQSVAYGAFLNFGDTQVVSFSPELFFRTEKDKIITRPMKGTMVRGIDEREDEEMALRLKTDEKNLSEHVMIVDLLRNDLGKICVPGSVRVENLFGVERYETLFQMTSTVSGKLRSQARYYDVFRALFPSGSITGAPKIASMRIIRELEQRPRGIYTGTIGFMSPTGSSCFNVAIRTLLMTKEGASMGVGGGIVADSDPHEEYRECLLKASFLKQARPRFQLIETMLWDLQFPLLILHLERLESSARYFGFLLDRETLIFRLNELAASFQAGNRYRVRVLLDSAGNLSLARSVLPPVTAELRVKVSTNTTSSRDFLLRHKTTNRAMYDRCLQEARTEGFDDVIFLNAEGQVTEGAVSNVFVQRAGKWLTPPVSCGALPGVFRRHLLETCPDKQEQVLTLKDLQSADGIYLCNAVSGLRRITALSVPEEFRY